MYSAVGRPSIPPEEGFVQETFSKNRERLMKHHVAEQFFAKIVEQARAAGQMSDDHFTVDGTLIEAWASLKSFRPKDEKPGDRPPPDDEGNPSVDFHGEKRSNETHQSTTDPEAKLAKKAAGKEAKLSYAQHALMENRTGWRQRLRHARLHRWLPRPQRDTARRTERLALWRLSHRWTDDTPSFNDGRQRRWICIIDAPNVGRFGGTALAMMIASPRIASPAPTSVCAMVAIIASVESNGCGTRRATTPQ